jgi:hypothetical protein
MATATVNTITLTLTDDEAADLRFVLGFIGGTSHYGETVRSVFNALRDVGVPWPYGEDVYDSRKPVVSSVINPSLMFNND